MTGVLVNGEIWRQKQIQGKTDVKVNDWSKNSQKPRPKTAGTGLGSIKEEFPGRFQEGNGSDTLIWGF